MFRATTLVLGLLLVGVSRGESIRFHPVAPEDFTGSTQAGDLIGGNAFQSGFSVNWTITQQNNGFLYAYQFGGVSKAISHVLFELSANCTLDCIEDWAPWLRIDEDAPRIYQAGAPPDLNLPADVFGVKFDFLADQTGVATVWFTSPRAPMWGDFFARSGTTPQEGASYVYNTGLTEQGGAFIPTPDTATAVVPEPAALALAATAAAGLLIVWRRRRRA